MAVLVEERAPPSLLRGAMAIGSPGLTAKLEKRANHHIMAASAGAPRGKRCKLGTRQQNSVGRPRNPARAAGRD
jgi:hypothetical protein